MDASVIYIGLVVLAVLGVAYHVRYRERHPYTEGDLRGAREEAARGSRATRGGLAVEQLAPLLPKFCERFNPAEAMFLGKPVDYVIFDGLEQRQIRRVVFVEVKSGRQDLTPVQRQVRDAVREQRLDFDVLRLP